MRPEEREEEEEEREEEEEEREEEEGEHVGSSPSLAIMIREEHLFFSYLYLGRLLQDKHQDCRGDRAGGQQC